MEAQRFDIRSPNEAPDRRQPAKHALMSLGNMNKELPFKEIKNGIRKKIG